MLLVLIIAITYGSRRPSPAAIRDPEHSLHRCEGLPTKMKAFSSADSCKICHTYEINVHPVCHTSGAQLCRCECDGEEQ